MGENIAAMFIGLLTGLFIMGAVYYIILIPMGV